MDKPLFGPLLTDQEFFANKVNAALPGLEGLAEAAALGDFAKAREIFARRIRASLQPKKLLSITYFQPENSYMFKGETEREAADRFCCNELMSCGTAHKFGAEIDWFANPTFNQYKEWTWQLSRHNEWKILGHVYSATGDEKYAECCARLFTSWVRQAVTPEPGTDGGATKCWRTIECGIRMAQTWPYALHYFIGSPHFTDELICDWYKSICEHGRRLKNEHRDGNWLLMEMEGLAFIGMLCPELSDSQQWLEFALNMMEKQIPLQFYPDGFQYELTTNYHRVSLNCYLRLIRVARMYGVAIKDSLIAALEPAFDHYTYITMPDGRLPDLNDGSWEQTSAHLTTNADFFTDRQDLLWFRTKGEQGKPPAFTSVAMPYSGFMAMRSGWEKEALWALFDAAPFGRGHQHEDKLSIMVCAGGKLLVTEGGNYAYDASEMRKYVLSTRSHNTIRVDGFDQNRRLHYAWNAEDIKKHSGMVYRIEDGFDYACGEYNEGYGPFAERLAKHTREVFMFKKPPSGLAPFLVVADALTAAETRKYEALWHLDSEVTLSGLTATMPSLTVLASGENVAAELVTAQEEPEWQGWKTTGTTQGMFAPCPTLRVTFEGATASLFTVLYPAGGDECPIKGIKKAEATDISLEMKDGSIISFCLNDCR